MLLETDQPDPSYTDSSSNSGQEYTESHSRAGQLYTTLQRYASRVDNYVMLNGFYNAVRYSRQDGTILRGQIVYPTVDLEEESLNHYYQLGFSEADLNSGLFLIQKSKASFSPEVLAVTSTQARERRVLISSAPATSNPLIFDENSGTPTELTADEIDTVNGMLDLSAIPFEILNNYPNYDAFQDGVYKSTGRSFHPVGIDFVDRKSVLLYNGGLRQYVNLISKSKTGLSSSNSTEIVIGERLDRTSHFRKIRNILNRRQYSD